MDRHRETDRYRQDTDRHIKTDGQTQTDRDRLNNIERHRQTDGQIWTDRQTYRPWAV